MEFTLLQTHQSEFVRLFSSLNRNVDEVHFMSGLQQLILSLKMTIIKYEEPSVKHAHFTILTLLFKLIAYTRDIYGGLGERKLTYMMLFIWNHHFPLPTAQCVQKLIMPFEGNPPYGSWLDIKHFCDFIKNNSASGEQDPLIEVCIGMMNHQLILDDIKWKESPESVGISLACKWIPREKSAFGWIFKRCAIQWIRAMKPAYFKSCQNEAQFQGALRKGSKEYRQLFTTLSKACQTLEIKQCSNQWHDIQVSQLPMVALQRQQEALLNIGRNGNIRDKTKDCLQRQVCAAKLKLHWVSNAAHKETHLDEVNPIFTNMGELIKTAFRVSSSVEIKRVENEWKHILVQVRELKQMMPILDMSLFYTNPDSFYDALGMACIVAMKTSKRILLFDKTVHFINLEACDSLTEILGILKPIFHEHHIGQSFEAVCDTLIQSLKEVGMLSCENMKLVFFTHFRDSDIGTIVDNIEKRFTENGWSRPFLLFWRGFQEQEKECHSSFPMRRTIFISGNTNYIWTRISNIPEEAWEHLTAFDFITIILSQPRYSRFEIG